MTHANDNTPILISIKDAARMANLSRTSINNLRSAGAFPAEVMLGEKRVAFVRAEVVAWIQERIDARPQSRAA